MELIGSILAVLIAIAVLALVFFLFVSYPNFLFLITSYSVSQAITGNHSFPRHRTENTNHSHFQLISLGIRPILTLFDGITTFSVISVYQLDAVASRSC